MTLSPYWLLLLTFLLPLPFSTGPARAAHALGDLHADCAERRRVLLYGAGNLCPLGAGPKCAALYDPADGDFYPCQSGSSLLEHDVFVAVRAACGRSAGLGSVPGAVSGAAALRRGCCTWRLWCCLRPKSWFRWSAHPGRSPQFLPRSPFGFTGRRYACSGCPARSSAPLGGSWKCRQWPGSGYGCCKTSAAASSF